MGHKVNTIHNDFRKRTALLAAITTFFAIAAQGASNAAPPAAPAAFATAPAASPAVRSAHAAQDVAIASRLVGKQASFRGQVARVYVASYGDFATVDFDKQYKNAVVAVAKADALKKLPRLETLTGRTIVVTGAVCLYKGQPEVEIKSPSQIVIVDDALRRAAK